MKERIDWYVWELQSEIELWLGYYISYSTIWRAIYCFGYIHKQVKEFFYIVIVSFFINAILQLNLFYLF